MTEVVEIQEQTKGSISTQRSKTAISSSKVVLRAIGSFLKERSDDPGKLGGPGFGSDVYRAGLSFLKLIVTQLYRGSFDGFFSDFLKNESAESKDVYIDIVRKLFMFWDHNKYMMGTSTGSLGEFLHGLYSHIDSF